MLEAKENLQKVLANIPLIEDERDTVDDGQAALSKLLDRLADIPTSKRHPSPGDTAAG